RPACHPAVGRRQRCPRSSVEPGPNRCVLMRDSPCDVWRTGQGPRGAADSEGVSPRCRSVTGSPGPPPSSVQLLSFNTGRMDPTQLALKKPRQTRGIPEPDLPQRLSMSLTEMTQV